MDDFFGSDSGSDVEKDDQGLRSHGSNASMNEFFEESDSEHPDKKLNSSPSLKRIRGIKLEDSSFPEIIKMDVQIKYPERISFDKEQTFLTHLPNFLEFEPSPFDPDTYRMEEKSVLDKDADDEERRIHLKVENSIRWRYFKDEDDVLHKQSNAKFVKWSDGSMSLMVGNEFFDVQTKDIGDEKSFLYEYHSSEGLLQANIKLSQKMSFQPSSTDSQAHQKLTQAIVSRNLKEAKVKYAPTVKDPEREKAELEKLQNEKIKNWKKMEQKKQKAALKDQRVTSKPLTEDMLEEEEDDDENDKNDESDMDDFIDDEDEMEQDEEEDNASQEDDDIDIQKPLPKRSVSKMEIDDDDEEYNSKVSVRSRKVVLSDEESE